MDTKFPFVSIPMEFARIMGRPDKGTRIFRREGTHREMTEWFDALCHYIGPCVSPGGAAVYAGVTRAGVHKRLKTGGLTAFCFHITAKKKTVFGGEKMLKELPLVYIPSQECKAWGKELDERLARIEAAKTATAEDEAAFEEADPGEENRDDHFPQYDPNDKGRKSLRAPYPWENIDTLSKQQDEEEKK